MKRLELIALRTAVGLLMGLILALMVVRVLYGGGEPYPDLSTAPAVPSSDVEVLVELDLPPGNVTSAADGRIFFNTHPFAQSQRFADAFLFELVEGQPRPYPNEALQPDLQWVFGMTVDRQGRLWVISPATLDRERTRLQAFDLTTDERVVDHEFEPGVARFSQDLRIMPDGRTAILADTGAFRFTSASILVVDLQTWQVRERLEGHPSTQPQDWTIATEHGPHSVGWGLVTFSVGVDGIAVSPDGAWLYYATMSHDTLYRVPTEALLDASTSDAQLAARIEPLGPKPLSDGIELTADGTVVVTDIEHGGVAAMKPGGGAGSDSLRTLVKLEDIVWADGVNVMHDGRVLLTDSAIPEYLDPWLRPPARERLEAGRPYRIYRFATPGR
ncbi:MAG: L-dopachrome tautomerase-related protein [Nannocystaceae bacterium]